MPDYEMQMLLRISAHDPEALERWYVERRRRGFDPPMITEAVIISTVADWSRTAEGEFHYYAPASLQVVDKLHVFWAFAKRYSRTMRWAEEVEALTYAKLFTSPDGALYPFKFNARKLRKWILSRCQSFGCTFQAIAGRGTCGGHPSSGT